MPHKSRQLNDPDDEDQRTIGLICAIVGQCTWEHHAPTACPWTATASLTAGGIRGRDLEDEHGDTARPRDALPGSSPCGAWRLRPGEVGCERRCAGLRDLPRPAANHGPPPPA